MPTCRARSRSVICESPPSRAIFHAASRISSLVAERRSVTRSLIGVTNMVRSLPREKADVKGRRTSASACNGRASLFGEEWLTGKYQRDADPTGATRLGEDPKRGMEAWEPRNMQERT